MGDTFPTLGFESLHPGCSHYRVVILKIYQRMQTASRGVMNRAPTSQIGQYMCVVCCVLCVSFTHPPLLCISVANRTVDQANIVGETAVAGANEVSQASVEGVENVVASTGLINQVSSHSNSGLHRQLV